MKQLKCTDACPEGVTTCVYVIEEETDDEVIDRMKMHASVVHADVMEKMSEEDRDGWVDKARTKITTS